MKPIKPIGHVAIGIFFFIAAFSLFTFLPFILPYPELISPPTYLVVALLGFFALFTLKNRQLFWTYLPIPLVTLFGFLEEASYGIEGGRFNALYWEEYHVQVYDLHNLIPVLLQITNSTLEKNHWDFAFFQQTITIDLVILVGLSVFILVSGVRRLRDEISILQTRLLMVASIFVFVVSLVALIWLLSFPADSKNALLLGYSPFRIGSAAVLIIIGILPLAYLFIGNLISKEHRLKTSQYFVSRWRKPIAAGGIFLLLGSLAWQIWAPLNTYENLALIERLNPLVVWITTIACLTLVGIWAWHGALGSLLARSAKFAGTFPQRHPAYIYVVIGAFLVIFAQAMDQDRISLAQYISLPNPWGESWNSFIEETLELIGAYELALAVFFFTLGRPKGHLNGRNKKSGTVSH